VLADLYRRLGALELEIGNNAAAEVACREAVRLNPTSVPDRVGLALVLARQEKNAQAKQQLDEVLRSATDDSAAWRTVGKAWLQMGSADQAVAHLRRATELAPEDAGIRFDFAVALQLGRDYQGAINQYKLILTRDPSSSRAANNLAWLYATEGNDTVRDGAQAVQLAQLACRLTQNENPSYLGTLGAALARVGKFDAAVEVTDRAQRLARSTGQDELAAALRGRLELFRAGRAFE
jgi:tetratricopeptide (TPR) repeat protein